MSIRIATISIAMFGDRNPSYPSHREADAVIPMLGKDVSAEWVPTDAATDLAGFDGVWLMPGSPYRDDAAAYAAVAFARTRGVPFLGTCGGLQYAVVEYVRNALGVAGASHAETDGAGPTNVVSAMACSVFGQEREVRPVQGTRFAALAAAPFTGMHYCSYAPSAEAIRLLVGAGWEVGADADDVEAEVLDLTTHAFFVLSLFQPQIGALAGRPLHPLIREFVRQAGVFSAAR